MPYAAVMAPPIRRRPSDDPAAATPPRRPIRARLVRGAALALGVVAVGVGAACSSATVPSDPTLAKGQEIYSRNCVACHGVGGGGGSAPRLIGIADRMTEEQEIAKVTNGVAGTAMPAWGGRLSTEDIAAVTAYTRSLTPGS